FLFNVVWLALRHEKILVAGRRTSPLRGLTPPLLVANLYSTSPINFRERVLTMKSLRSCGLTLLLKAAGCECFWVGARNGCARHPAAIAQPSMTFLDDDKSRPLAGSRNGFMSSQSRLATTGKKTQCSPTHAAVVEETPLDCSSLEFSTKEEHRRHLEGQSKLPKGFRVGTAGFRFVPEEVPKEVCMNVTAIVMDEPSDRWAAVFTRNLFPGAPVLVGRERLAAEGRALQGVIINNKISNVCPAGDTGTGGGAGGGVADSESVCQRMADEFGFDGGAGAVLPCSTGVIGWRLPVADICDKLASVRGAMQSESLFPAAESIMTTDRYPKLRGTRVGSNGGRLVGIAKGAGMIEPNMATMLSYLITDLQIPREKMRELLSEKADATFNCISIDSDTSTSDTVVLLSSGKVPLADGDLEDFEEKLEAVCAGLAEDVVRNGEGTGHVMEVRVSGAPTSDIARRLGKAVVNSPLFKSAIAGNDPNVGRLLAVVGRFMAIESPGADVISLGGHVVFERNAFSISPGIESDLFDLFKVSIGGGIKWN
ncbi:unnamed protein product, partial [Ascophyllum nodosum]